MILPNLRANVPSRAEQGKEWVWGQKAPVPGSNGVGNAERDDSGEGRSDTTSISSRLTSGSSEANDPDDEDYVDR